MSCSELARLLALTLAVASAGCVRFSAFEVDPGESNRDLSAKNLTLLAARQREPASPKRPLTFALIADTHDGYSEFRDIVRAINARPEIELVLHAGDFTDFGTQQEYGWALDCLKDLSAPFIVAPGNHDGLAEGETLYALTFGPDNLRFEYAAQEFIVFNTNTIEWDLEQPDFEFLEMATQSSLPKLLLTHQPPYSEPHLTPEVSARFVDLLAPVRAYLYGHVHEGFALERVGETEFIKTETALEGGWMLLTTDGTKLEVQACRFDACGDQPLLDVAPGATPPEPQPAETG